MQVITYSDGGARGNPGPSGIGGVIYSSDQTQKLAEISEFLGHATNNQAEYTALLRIMEKAKEIGATEVICKLDSELVVKQLNGQYKVKNVDLQKIFVKVFNLSQSFSSVKYEHVRREFNKEADALANQAMDKAKN
jgi:ribonuclease HI